MQITAFKYIQCYYSTEEKQVQAVVGVEFKYIQCYYSTC